MFKLTHLTRPACRPVLISAMTLSVALIGASLAHADYHVVVCSDLTTGAPSNASGWSDSTSGAYVGASLCNGGGDLDAALFAGVSHNYTDNASLVFNAPANTTIASFSLWRWDQAAASQPFGSPVNTFAYDGQVIDNCSQAWGCTQEGFTNAPAQSVIGATGLNAHQITAIAACGGGPGGVCPSSSEPSEIRIYGGDIDLNQSTSPTVSAATGSLVAPGAHSGTETASFNASDNGSGVYSATLLIDGQVAQSQILNTNGGRCQPTRQNPDGSLVFNYVQPCPASAAGLFTYNTAAVKDGNHTLQIRVSDAAGNTTFAFDGTITTSNAPVPSSPPSTSGSPQVGGQLTGADTTFSSPAGAGPVTVTRGFERCDSQGNNCAPITGATSTTYTLTAADVGSTIRFQNIATNNDGRTVSASQPTPLITQPSPGSSGGATGGSASAGSGGSGGSAAGGAGGPGASSGSSSSTGVTITITPSGTVTATLGSKRAWALSLKVAPQLVHRHSLARLTGRVSTTPLPAQGKLVLLQARSVRTTWRGRGPHRHQVTVYGRWITFKALRAGHKGAFAASYRFRLGGRHIYQLQAVAPKEGGYRNATGRSRVVTVTET